MKEFDFQLEELGTQRALNHTGKIVVTTAGTAIALQLYDSSDATAATPKAFTAGHINFRVAETVNKVDIYGYTDQGYAFQIKGLRAGEISTYLIDTNRLVQHYIYPINFSTSNTYGDSRTISASAANSTGIFLPDGAMLMPQHTGVLVTTAESGKTVDVGVLGAASGISTDADGLMDGISLAATGFKPATIGYTIGSNSVYADLTGGTAEWTSGALFHPASTKVANAEGTDSATTKNGFYIYSDCVMINSGSNTTELTYTFAGTPTAVKGFIQLAWRLPNVTAYS